MADTENNAKLEQLLHAINHDLRTPLGNIRSATTILLQDLGDSLTDEQHVFLDIINSSVIRILDQSNRLGMFGEIAFEQSKKQQVQLSEILANAKKTLRNNYDIVEITFISNVDPLVNCYPQSFAALIALLASGDYKYLTETDLTNAPSPIVEVQIQENQIIFSIMSQMPASNNTPSFANLALEIVKMQGGMLEMGAKNGRFHSTLSLPRTS